jgi:hypothetical protein
MRRFISVAAFTFLTSTILVMASERAYWYWTGISVDSVLFISVFYLLPAMAGLWTLALTPARRLHQVLLAGAMFAIVVEGVLTPVIYLDGPLPVMAFMFVGWHGLVAFGGFWYLARRLLVEGRRLVLALVSAAFGSFWGVWALAAAIGDPADEEGILDGLDPTVLDPVGFARYAFAVGAVLAIAHWLLGFVWPRGWRPSPRSTRLVWFACGAYMSVAVVPVLFWAPLKLAVMIGGTWWLLRRSRRGVATAEPTVLDSLSGSVSPLSVLPVLTMPAVAALTYWAGWGLPLSEGGLAGIYGALVGLQVIAGGAAFVWAARRAMQVPERVSSLPAPPPMPQESSTQESGSAR